MTYSFGEGAPFSVSLYAEAFDVPLAEAESDLAALLSMSGVFPVSLREGGRVLTQGIAIPLWADGTVPVLYLYALATEPASRGQGLLRTLIREIAVRAKESSYSALCLLPADEALAAAYRRMGFTEERPAGGGPVLGRADTLSWILTAPPDFSPCPPDALRIPFGNALPREIFAYAFSSLGERVMACRIGGEYAILHKEDPRYALALTEGLRATARPCDHHRYLLMPLGGALPRSIPEPLPR
jgi:predicted N-acetyltransferase YhbS